MLACPLTSAEKLDRSWKANISLPFLCFVVLPLSSACFHKKHHLTFEAISAAFHSKMLCTIISEKENSSLNKIVRVAFMMVSKYWQSCFVGRKIMRRELSWNSRMPKRAGTSVGKLILPHLVVRYSKGWRFSSSVVCMCRSSCDQECRRQRGKTQEHDLSLTWASECPGWIRKTFGNSSLLNIFMFN